MDLCEDKNLKIIPNFIHHKPSLHHYSFTAPRKNSFSTKKYLPKFQAFFFSDKFILSVYKFDKMALTQR